MGLNLNVNKIRKLIDNPYKTKPPLPTDEYVDGCSFDFDNTLVYFDIFKRVDKGQQYSYIVIRNDNNFLSVNNLDAAQEIIIDYVRDLLFG